jgi:hypothetical protein
MSIFTDRQWAKAGPIVRAQMAAGRAPIERVMVSTQIKGLGGVEFASDAARSLAMDERLSWPVFSVERPSSARGFTVGDVRGIIERIESHGE